MASEKTIEELIAQSSLGTVGAQAVRERADPKEVDEVLRRVRRLKLAEDAFDLATKNEAEFVLKAFDKQDKLIAYSKAAPGDTIEDVRARTWVK